MAKKLLFALLLFPCLAWGQQALVTCNPGVPCSSSSGPANTGGGMPAWQAFGTINDSLTIANQSANIMAYGAFCDTVYTVPGATTTINATSGSPVVVISGSSIGNNFVGATIVIGLLGSGGLPLRSTIASIAGTSITLNDNSLATYAGPSRYAYGHDDQPAIAAAFASGAHTVYLPANKTCGIRSTVSITNVRPVIFDLNGSPLVALTSLGGSAMIKTPATGGGFWQAIGSQVRNGILDGMGVAAYNLEATASVQWHFHDLTLLNAATTNIYVHGTALNNDFSEIGIYNEAYTVPLPGATGYGIDIGPTNPTDNRFRNIIGGGGANPSGFASGGVHDTTFGTFYENIHFYSVHNGPSFCICGGATHGLNLYADMGASQPSQPGFLVNTQYNVITNWFSYASGTYAGQIGMQVTSNGYNNIGPGVCEGIDTASNCIVGGGGRNNIYPATGSINGTMTADEAVSPQIIPIFDSTPTVTNHFCPPSFGTCNNGPTKVNAISPRDGVFSNLFCTSTTAPGGIETYTVTWQINNSATVLQCTITGASQTCKDGSGNTGDNFANTGHAPGISQGQTYYADITPSAAAAAASLYCGVEFTTHAQ